MKKKNKKQALKSEHEIIALARELRASWETNKSVNSSQSILAEELLKFRAMSGERISNSEILVLSFEECDSYIYGYLQNREKEETDLIKIWHPSRIKNFPKTHLWKIAVGNNEPQYYIEDPNSCGELLKTIKNMLTEELAKHI